MLEKLNKNEMLIYSINIGKKNLGIALSIYCMYDNNNNIVQRTSNFLEHNELNISSLTTIVQYCTYQILFVHSDVRTNNESINPDPTLEILQTILYICNFIQLVEPPLIIYLVIDPDIYNIINNDKFKNLYPYINNFTIRWLLSPIGQYDKEIKDNSNNFDYIKIIYNEKLLHNFCNITPEQNTQITSNIKIMDQPSVYIVNNALNSIKRYFSSSNYTLVPLKMQEYINPEYPSYAPLITCPLFTQSNETFLRTSLPSQLEDDGGIWRYEVQCKYRNQEKSININTTTNSNSYNTVEIDDTVTSYKSLIEDTLIQKNIKRRRQDTTTNCKYGKALNNLLSTVYNISIDDSITLQKHKYDLIYEKLVEKVYKQVQIQQENKDTQKTFLLNNTTTISNNPILYKNIIKDHSQAFIHDLQDKVWRENVVESSLLHNYPPSKDYNNKQNILMRNINNDVEFRIVDTISKYAPSTNSSNYKYLEYTRKQFLNLLWYLYKKPQYLSGCWLPLFDISCETFLQAPLLSYFVTNTIYTNTRSNIHASNLSYWTSRLIIQYLYLAMSYYKYVLRRQLSDQQGEKNTEKQLQSNRKVDCDVESRGV